LGRRSAAALAVDLHVQVTHRIVFGAHQLLKVAGVLGQHRLHVVRGRERERDFGASGA
jgi:hypothetical protein